MTCVHSSPSVFCLIAGTFKLTLEFTEDYPNKAPVVKFKSTLFHPNGESVLLHCICSCNCASGHRLRMVVWHWPIHERLL